MFFSSLKLFILKKIYTEGSNSKFYANLGKCIYILKTGSDRYPIAHNCRDYTDSAYVRFLLGLIAMPLGIFRYFFPGKVSNSGREGLAIVLITKNEAPYIKEWLDFHLKQGVTNFIIYDNESTDNFREVLQPYIDSGIVIYNVIKGRVRQIDAYNKAFWNYRHKFKYMAVIDADEFIFVRNNNSEDCNLYKFVDDFMTSHENAGGLVVNWCIFGSSRYEKKPTGGVLNNFIMRSEDNFERNKNVKTICDPLKVLGWNYPHQPAYLRNFYSLDENGKIVKTVVTEKVSFKKIRINHYFTKSKEEYLQKKSRGYADSTKERPMDAFYANDKNDVKDTEIISHI